MKNIKLPHFVPVSTIINGSEAEINISRDIIGQIIPLTKFTSKTVLNNGVDFFRNAKIQSTANRGR